MTMPDDRAGGMPAGRDGNRVGRLRPIDRYPPARALSFRPAGVWSGVVLTRFAQEIP
ncbi:MAG: hypothetical protein U0802_14115 [Candidatus Binatia bacterium]